MLSFSEMLKGKQHKLDKNKNGKVDSHDFKLLRKEEQELEEASKSGEGKVETKKYSWGTMKTVHHGSEFSVPLHPEHHQAIAKLKDNQEHKFKDETGRHWTAKRMGDKVHIHGSNDGGKTVVNHSDLKEEVEELEEAKPGLYANINAKRKRIEAGSGERMRKPGSKGAPSAKDFKDAAKTANEEVELDEERINGREYASQGVMHPDHAKMDIHKVSNQHVDFYASKTGDKMQGKVVKNDGKSVHIQAHKELGDGKLHKFKVQRGLPKPTNEEVDLEEKMDMSKADMGAVIKDFKKSDAPQFAGKSVEKRRQMAIAAKLQADRVKKEGVEMKSYKQFMEELVDKLPELDESELSESVDVGDSDEASSAHQKYAAKTKPTHEFKTDDGAHHKVWHHTDSKGKKSTLIHTKEPGVGGAPVMKLDQAGHHHPDDIKKSIHHYMNEEVEQIDELDKNLIKSIMKNPMPARPKTSSDEIDKSTGKLKPYGYRGKSEYEKSETGDDEEPKKRGRKAGVSVGTYKRR